MAADSMVTHFNYPVDGSRKPFPYEVWIPYHDEPEYLIEDLRERAAYTLNVGRVSVLANRTGIKETHAKIGGLSATPMVLVLDSDLVLDAGPFQMFPTELFEDEFEYVHLWHVRNPINGLVYGHGGPKLFKREHLLGIPGDAVDMTTSVGKGHTIYTECVGTHAFNWSAESTWRTAFREAAKLAHLVSSQDERINDDARTEAHQRLNAWLYEEDISAAYSEFCIAGARAGDTFSGANESIAQINDYAWLHDQFKQQFPNDY